MRSAVIGFLLLIVFAGLLAISGCHGGGSIGPVANVTVTPTSLSLSPGEVSGLTSKATDKNGNTVGNTTFTYAVTGGVVSVSNNGLVCAGTWDSVTTPINCMKGSTGTATIKVTATGGGGTATSADIPVTVHQKIDAVRIAPVGTAPSCVSQGATAPANTEQFQATALSNDPAFCGSAGTPCPVPNPGTFAFNSSQPTVGTISTTQPTGQDPADITVTAGNPGVSNITATIAGVGSSPATFITCAARSISLHVSGSSATSFSIAQAGTQALAAAVVDT